MKKVTFILSTIILCFLTISLAIDSMYDISSEHNDLAIPVSIPYKELSLLPKEYLPEEAIRNGDVVSLHHLNYNVNLLDSFIERYKEGTIKPNEMVRITRYTVEGEPIISDLIFENNKLTLKKDKSRNFYSSPEDLIIKEYEIKLIYTKITNNTIFYMTETTSGEKFPIAEFSLN